MTEQLRTLDHQLFFFVNHTLQNGFFDWLMPYLRNRLFWVPLYLFLVAFFIVNFKKQSLWIIGLLLLAFAVSDFTSSSIVKPFFERLRPCRDPLVAPHVHLLSPCGSGFSFVSAHAANHFALAMFFIQLFYRQFRWIIPISLFWAWIICFAQIYVGLHFPSDIVGGAVLGALVGFGCGRLALRKVILTR